MAKRTRNLYVQKHGRLRGQTRKICNPALARKLHSIWNAEKNPHGDIAGAHEGFDGNGARRGNHDF